MARWRLAAPHYLHVPGTEWEYSENDRTTGRPKRIKFKVPRLLNPEDPSDWNYVYSKDGFGKPDTGEIVVTNRESEAFPRDILFTSPPTPDMVPMDDEAREISAKLQANFKHPINDLPGTYADEMLKDLSAEIDKVRTQQTGEVKVEGMAELLAAMTGMMKQNQDLLAALLQAQTGTGAKPAAGRRA